MKQLLLAGVVLTSLFLLGCKSEQYGSGIDPKLPKVQVKDMFLQKDLIGSQVTLEGRIVSQCQSNGCWFFLQDETGQVYIDLAKNNFSLPSLPGKQVVASGTVARSNQNYLLIATGVEVK